MPEASSKADTQAFWRVKQAAESGQAKAQYNLGLMYANGVGVAQDFQQAIHWYQQAANQGYSPAQYILAGKYASGQGVERDPRQALSWYLKASDKGNSRALFKLGQMLSVPQEEIARNCYRQAAEKGVVEAQVLVAADAVAGAEGLSGQTDAFEWYRKAAESGMPAAQYIVGTYYENGSAGHRDIQLALSWYRKAARQGFAAAQMQLGMMYLAGEDLPRDNKQAFMWVSRAAEQSDPEACYQLGLMYEQGIGVPCDQALAEKSYLKAAERGDVRAQLLLGQLFAPERTSQAEYWYRQAASEGSPEAMLWLGRQYAEIRGDPEAREKALSLLLQAHERGEAAAAHELAGLLSQNDPAMLAAWYEKAARAGIPEAQLAYALHLEDWGELIGGAERSLDWLLAAAESGLPEAQFRLALALQSEGGGAQQADAVAWLRKAAKQGYAQAQGELGKHYAAGTWGLTRDKRQAESWLSKAAGQGVAEAQLALGQLLAEGAPQGEVLAQADYWLRQAIDHGAGAPAALALADLSLGRADFVEAENRLRQAAAEGSELAGVQLGKLLLSKREGKAAVEALSCYLQAAGKGSLEALRTLALLASTQPQAFARTLRQLAVDAGAVEMTVGAESANEIAPPAAPEKTDKTLLAVAKEGNPVAQWRVAEIFAKGLDGERKNMKQAVYWYTQAAENGFAAAQATLALLFSTGQGGVQDSQQAAQWWERAAAQGDGESQYNLAVMYEKGEGVAKDPEKVLHWLTMAARQGIAAAQSRLGLAYATGSGGAPDLVEAHAWFAMAARGGDKAAVANQKYAESLMSEAQVEMAKARFLALTADLQVSGS